MGCPWRLECALDLRHGVVRRKKGGVDLDVVVAPAVNDGELRLRLSERPILSFELTLEDNVERAAHADEEHGEIRPESSAFVEPRLLQEDMVDDDIQPGTG
jgi:hypothetical protein